MKKQLFLFAFLLIFLSFVSAVPPVTTTTNFPTGYVLLESYNDYLKINGDFSYYFFVQNSSNGVFIDNSSVSCNFFMANSSHDVNLAVNAKYNPVGYWYVDIEGSNFSSIGIFNYGLFCQNGNQGGSLSGAFEVTRTGKTLETSQSIIYIGILVIMIGILISSFFVINLLPQDNERDEDGRILSVNYLKHFRLVLWLFNYFLFMAIIFVSANISLAYLKEEMVGNLLFSVFSILMYLSPLVVIILLISFFVKFFHDRQFQNILNRGMFPGGRV